MAMLKEKNPEQHDKLMKLHQENPEEFRKALREHMGGEMVKRKLEGYPELQEAILKMSPERRAKVIGHLLGQEGASPMTRPSRPEEPPKAAPGDGRSLRPESMGNLRDLMQKARNAKTPGEKEAAVADLTEAAKKVHEQHVQERMRQLEYLEGKIKEIRAEMEDMQKNRDKIIKERIERALSEEPRHPDCGRFRQNP